MTWPKRIASRPWIYGHRGVRGPDVAENTVSAFERALAEGADGIEFDVRLNHEGAVLVFHDVSLERMTAGADARRLYDLSLSELRGISLVNHGTIPTLEDVLKWAVDKDLYLNVELKPDEENSETLAAAVASQLDVYTKQGMQARILLSSFSSRVRSWVEGHQVPLPYGVLLEGKARQLPTPTSKGAFGLHPNVESLALLHPQGAWAFTNVWTVNCPEVARELDSFGVDGLITDHPGAIRSLF